MPRAVARRTDPDTSWAAAHSVDHIRESQQRVLELLYQFGPMTDEEIREAWDAAMPNVPISDSGLRTRRRELVDMRLVYWTGHEKRTRANRRTKIWRITDHQLPLELFEAGA